MEKQLPVGWKSAIDPQSLRVYYYNCELKKNQTEFPVDVVGNTSIPNHQQQQPQPQLKHEQIALIDKIPELQLTNGICPDYITQLCVKDTTITNCNTDCDYGKYYYKVNTTKVDIRKYIKTLSSSIIEEGNGTVEQLQKDKYILWIEPTVSEIAEMKDIFGDERSEQFKRTLDHMQTDEYKQYIKENPNENWRWDYRRHNTIPKECEYYNFKTNFKKFFKINDTYISIWKIESSKIDKIKMYMQRDLQYPSSNIFDVNILCFRPSILYPSTNGNQCNYIPFIPLCFASEQSKQKDSPVMEILKSSSMTPTNIYKTFMSNTRVIDSIDEWNFSATHGVGNDKLLTGEYYVFNELMFNTIQSEFAIV
jgi:hypothetical protein